MEVANDNTHLQQVFINNENFRSEGSIWLSGSLNRKWDYSIPLLGFGCKVSNLFITKLNHLLVEQLNTEDISFWSRLTLQPIDRR